MKPCRMPAPSLTLLMAVAVAVSLLGCNVLFAQEVERDGDWMLSAPGDMSMELQLTPCSEAKPALKHRFIPSSFDQVQGNAAVFYLRALGFLEQSPARDELNKALKKASAEAESKGKAHDEVGPQSWQGLAPSELPIAEVKEYLKWSSFQTRDLAEARKRSYFSMERNVRQVDNPIGVLLPEIQSMRELARLQRLRCRLAIAEGELSKAEEVLGQQFAMARHMGDDGFFVSCLVGTAIQNVAIEDLLQYVGHPKSNNMYWALQTLPSPAVSYEAAFAFEYNFLFEQIKPLREVSDAVREPGYWSDFIDSVLPGMRSLQLLEGAEPTSRQSLPVYDRVSLINLIATNYLNAKQYLVEEWKLDQELLESMPTAQVVFLAIRRFYEMERDEHFKWASMPYHRCLDIDPDTRTKAQTEKWGWFTTPATAFLPAVPSVVRAQARMQQQIALVQVVESIRDYSASNAGKLPTSLNDLRLPAPKDPVSDLPFEYRLTGNKATLRGSRVNTVQYQLILSIRP